MTAPVQPNIVFDTDPGADDALALIWLCAIAAQQRCAIHALCAVGGNVGVRDTFDNAARLLRLCGRDDVPLALGRDSGGEHARHVHGADGLAGLRRTLAPAARTAAAAPAADALLAGLGRQVPVPDALVAVGPLTNLSAAAALDPQALARVPRIVVMGGALGAGNVTPHAEFNAHHNAPAWAHALRAGRLDVVTLDQTRRVWFARDEVNTDSIEGPVGAFVGQLIRRMCADGVKRSGQDRFFLHDAVAVAAACYPQWVHFRDVALEVTETGEARGALREVPGAAPNARVAHEIDAPAIKSALINDLVQLAASTQ